MSSALLKAQLSALLPTLAATTPVAPAPPAHSSRAAAKTAPSSALATAGASSRRASAVGVAGTGIRAGATASGKQSAARNGKTQRKRKRSSAPLQTQRQALQGTCAFVGCEGHLQYLFAASWALSWPLRSAVASCSLLPSADKVLVVARQLSSPLACFVCTAAIQEEEAAKKARYEYNLKYLRSHGTSKKAAALLQKMAAKAADKQ